LLLLPVYSAGERRIPGADSRALASSIRQRGKLDPVVIKEAAATADLLTELLLPGDLIVTQGAGSVGSLARSLVAQGFAS
jgi:UDP-N-acetylmuramate--alanine ligase